MRDWPTGARAVSTRVAVAVGCLGLVIAGWAASRAPAAFPGGNGMIVFTSQPGGNSEIFVMNANGSGQTNLTNNAAADIEPASSADAQRIAFNSSRNGGPSPAEIYVMNANGSGQTRLTNNSNFDGKPAWSPDGQRIAFESNRGGSDIFVMNANGSGQTNLTNDPVQAAGPPSWSPDGQKIAFRSSRDGNPEIYVMNANGSGQTRVTNNAADDIEPDWSPDGQRIAFTRGADIFVMNANGSGQTNLTNNALGNGSPAWSPDGEKIAFNSSRDGNLEIYVMNADGSAQTRLTNNAGGDFFPDWQVGCLAIGFACAQGSFTETDPGSGIFETDQRAWVGGFEIQPRPGGKLVLDINAPAVSESGAGVDVIFAGFAVPLPAAGLPVGFQNGTVEINQAGSLEKVLLKLPVKGQLKVAWTDGGSAASIEAEIEIEKLAAPIGALVSTSSLSTVGQTGGKLKARLVNGQGFVLDAAEVAIQEISVIPSSLRVPRTLTLRNLLLRFEIRDSKPFWTGQAGLRLPLTRGTPLDVTGRVFIFDGSLSGGGLAVDGLNRPLGATPIFLQSVSGDLLFAPTFGFDLTVGGSLGPRINGKQLLTLAGTLQNGEPARADCGGGLDPARLVLTSKLTPLEPFTAAGLAEAEMSGRACSFAGADRAMELKAEVKVAFLNEAVAYEASQTGLISTNGANLEGAAIVKLPALPDLEGKAIISTQGTAACVDFTFVEAGFGHRWGSGSPPSVFTGCDLGPFQVTVGARQTLAGSGAIKVPARLPHAGFAAAAAAGPPQVTVSGPGGFSVSSPADGSALRSANAVIVPDASDNTTYVLVRKPKAGDWLVESGDGSPLTQVRFAEGLPDPKVDGRVAKGKKKFRVSYDLRAIDGQKVTLFEAGEGIYRKLGKAKAGGGTLSFKPTLATDRKRTIEAEVNQDGLPRELITVAGFQAPKLPNLKVSKLKAERKKSSLVASWAKVAGSSEFLVEVQSGNKVLFRVLTAKRKLRFATPAKGKLKLSVQALSEARPPGPVAKLAVKPAKKR